MQTKQNACVQQSSLPSWPKLALTVRAVDWMLYACYTRGQYLCREHWHLKTQKTHIRGVMAPYPEGPRMEHFSLRLAAFPVRRWSCWRRTPRGSLCLREKDRYTESARSVSQARKASTRYTVHGKQKAGNSQAREASTRYTVHGKHAHLAIGSPCKRSSAWNRRWCHRHCHPA